MRIVFGGTGELRLSGGMIMVILVGNAMVELGHDVSFMSETPPEDWADVRIPHRPGSIATADDLRGVDAVITGWDGVEPALAAGVPVVAHFCAGYEPHLWPTLRERFEAVYRLPTLKLVIAPHLQETLRRETGVESTVVGAPIDLQAFSPAAASGPGTPPRVLTVGPEPDSPFAPVPFKGIADVLAIAAAARKRGHDFELVRLTPREDPLTGAPEIDELHVGIAPAEVPEIYRSCDVYLGASTAAEGLGMPAIEAGCSGLALVLPEIPSFMEIEELAPAALFYPPGEVATAAGRLERILTEPGLAQRLSGALDRERLTRRFSPKAVAERTVAAIAAARAA